MEKKQIFGLTLMFFTAFGVYAQVNKGKISKQQLPIIPVGEDAYLQWCTVFFPYESLA